MGIEPTSEAWEASILPLYDARSVAIVPANWPAGKRRRTRRYWLESFSQGSSLYAGGSGRLPAGGKWRMYVTIDQISSSLRMPFALGIPRWPEAVFLSPRKA